MPAPGEVRRVPQSMALRISCFRTDPHRPGRPRTRSKLTTEEREKVKQVRRQRACLRCKLLKIECSRENPCKPCLSSAVRGFERKVLSFCYCVRTRFADVNIFHLQSGFAESTPQDVWARVDALVARVAVANQRSTAGDGFEEAVVRWLTQPAYCLPNGRSIVGLLCSEIASPQLQDAIDADLAADLRRFLFATSMAHTGCWRGRASEGGERGSSSSATTTTTNVTRRDLCRIAYLSGSAIVRRLDRILTPQPATRDNRQASHQALLLLVLGIALGVGYSADLTTSPAFPHEMLAADLRQSPTLWLAMREHLAQMLAHHLIFLGSALGVKLDTAVERAIIDTAVHRWHKVERNVWADVLAGDRRSTPPEEPGGPVHGAARGYPSIPSILNPPETYGDVDYRGAFPFQSPPHLSSTPPLVALPCPDYAELRKVPELSPACDENPTSFLSMCDDMIDTTGIPSTAGDNTTAQLASPNPPRPPNTEQDDEPPSPPLRLVKRRSVWIVRPFDTGDGAQGVVNAHARIRLRRGESLGLFV